MDKGLISVRNLRKRYGSVVAVDGISFEVSRGEILGMVGPNGAGKTTTVECIEGLRRPDGGEVSVLSLDPRRDGFELRERIGVQLQECVLPDRIQVGEAAALFASFYRRTVDWRPLMDRLGLVEKIHSPFAKLSGGQKQRLFILLALINDPEVVFLDELTTGLDPQARRSMWDLVREIRDRGKTVLLTTHFMEEAERLCDRVAIVDSGKIVALDTPSGLIQSVGVDKRVSFNVAGKFDEGIFADCPGVSGVTRSGDRIAVQGRGDTIVGDVIRTLEAGGAGYSDLRTEQPSLEDVFLSLTGRELRE
jgi:ABC-2 type transport system ATP-binding protein